MNAAWLCLGSMLFFALGYRFYARFLSVRVFQLDPAERVPAHAQADGQDFVATDKHILLGHHYASIAGAAPIIGPAIAVIWGWGPALLWIVLGSVLMGAVHDFSTLVMSVRNGGKSIGSLSGQVLGERGRNLFLWSILALVLLVCAVFARAIAKLFVAQPATVIPINFEIVVALLIGWGCYRKKIPLLWPSLLSLLTLYGMIAVGLRFPISLTGLWPGQEITLWVLFLFAYAFSASLLPVWMLLQPRDLINSHQLFVGLGALLLAIFVVQPSMQAPMLNTSLSGAPPLFPLLFVTVACGAISGFHGLVSSGTSSKQLNTAPDARLVGYGAMLGEGLLAVIATLAVGAGLGNWAVHYPDFPTAASGGVSNFVNGAAQLLAGIGLPLDISKVVVALLVISFAATTLDTAVRIQRYLLQELAEIYSWSWLKRPLPAALLATLLPLLLCLAGQEQTLWPLFGASNQLLAGFSLLVVTLWLKAQGKAWQYTGVPMVLVLLVSGCALLINLQEYLAQGQWALLVAGSLLAGLFVWILADVVFQRTLNPQPDALKDKQ